MGAFVSKNKKKKIEDFNFYHFGHHKTDSLM